MPSAAWLACWWCHKIRIPTMCKMWLGSGGRGQAVLWLQLESLELALRILLMRAGEWRAGGLLATERSVSPRG